MENKKNRKVKIRYDRIIFTAIIFIGIVALVACGTNAIVKKSDNETETSDVLESETQPETETENPVKTANIVAMGDNLVQTRVYETAAENATDGQEYNFDVVYKDAIDLMTMGDLNIINQETPICNDEFDVSGSNFIFNSPTALGDYLIEKGVNGFSISNNHVLDMGTDGLRAQLDYWDKKVSEDPDLLVYGTYRNEDDMKNIRIKEINGVKIAFLAYTENTNGRSLEDGSEMKIIYTSDEDTIKSQIETAKKEADAVVVSMHWGNEDTNVVRDDVKELAKKVIDWGADVIIGTHPHVAQTMEYITRDDGSKGFVFYSLGNFVSAQTDNFNLVGELADFDITFNSNTNEISVENVQVTPVITQYENGSLDNIRVIPYYNYTEDLANAHGIKYSTSSTSAETMVWDMDTINGFIDTNIPKEYQCLEKPSRLNG